MEQLLTALISAVISNLPKGKNGKNSKNSKSESKNKQLLKSILYIVDAILISMALYGLYFGIQGLNGVRPVSAYEDKGVHSFMPVRVLPVRAANSSAGNSKQTGSTKLVYAVYYRTNEKPAYSWQKRYTNRSVATNILKQKAPVERQVFAIKDSKNYITLDKEQTIDAYVFSRKEKYFKILGIAGGLLIGYLLLYLIFRR